MTDTPDRFADLGLTTDGAYWGRWCRRHERMLADQAANRAEQAKKPKTVSPNPWAVGGNKETPDFRMLLLGPEHQRQHHELRRTLLASSWDFPGAE
jgi:hypothetical protein